MGLPQDADIYRYYDLDFARYLHFFQVWGRVSYSPATPAEVWRREFERRRRLLADAGGKARAALALVGASGAGKSSLTDEIIAHARSHPGVHAGMARLADVLGAGEGAMPSAVDNGFNSGRNRGIS